MWEIRRYSPDMKPEWDAFVEKARNSTFLFMRDYMDYHSSRFADCSLMAYRRGRLAAVLPANISGATLSSHAGLTYGGWVWAPSGLDTTDIFLLWRQWLQWCADESLSKIIYKPLPFIYARMPSEEDRYMLFLSGATLLSTDVSTAINLSCNPGFNKLQKRHLRAAEKDMYMEVHDFTNKDAVRRFHAMLTECLAERHGASPVHSAEEMELLMSRFRNILVRNVYSDATGDLLAGVCVYETHVCVHCQYIATSREGRRQNALSYLFNRLIDHYTDKGYRYFDFGISNENGRYLNPGLNRQKTSYGGSGVACQKYEISVSSALESLPISLWPPR